MLLRLPAHASPSVTYPTRIRVTHWLQPMPRPASSIRPFGSNGRRLRTARRRAISCPPIVSAWISTDNAWFTEILHPGAQTLPEPHRSIPHHHSAIRNRAPVGQGRPCRAATGSARPAGRSANSNLSRKVPREYHFVARRARQFCRSATGPTRARRRLSARPAGRSAHPSLSIHFDFNPAVLTETTR